MIKEQTYLAGYPYFITAVSVYGYLNPYVYIQCIMLWVIMDMNNKIAC